MTQRILVLSAGISVPSSTRILADRLADAATAAAGARGLDIEVEVLELRPLAHDLTDHLLTGFPSEALAEVLGRVRRAAALIVVTPVYAASYSGLFKTFVDVLEPGSLDAKPVLVAATAGTARHSMVLDHALRPLFTYLHAVVVPTGVFAASEDFGSTDEGHLDKRIERATDELAALLQPGAAPDPTIRRTVDDEFADPTPFDQLLRRAGGSPDF